MLKALAAAVRGGEWWDYKLVPILAAFYATSLYLRVPVASLWPAALILLLSLVPGAAFVSIVNDVADIRDDAAADKPNRMAGRSALVRALAIAVTLAGGAIFFWIWRNEPLLLACYGAAWIAFTLYSAPPLRLKARGLAGLLADASGAHLFPTLLAAAAAFAAAGRPAEPLWLGAIAIWSLACGARGIVWHQLLDRARDLEAGTGTFAARRRPEASARFAAGAFALELAGLLLLLLLLWQPLPALALAYHVLLARRRARIWGLETVVARPRAEYRLWLDDYYGAMLPVALLLAGAMYAPAELIVLAVHLLLFPKRPVEVARDSWILVVVPLFNRLARRRPMDAQRRERRRREG